jgi:hypothetical protein
VVDTASDTVVVAEVVAEVEVAVGKFVEVDLM